MKWTLCSASFVCKCLFMFQHCFLPCISKHSIMRIIEEYSYTTPNLQEKSVAPRLCISYINFKVRPVIKFPSFGQKYKFFRTCYVLPYGCTHLALSKGQIISKGLFGVLEFSQKMNERIRHSSKNEFVRFWENSRIP